MTALSCTFSKAVKVIQSHKKAAAGSQMSANSTVPCSELKSKHKTIPECTTMHILTL